jgi:DNA-binding transcriptional MerR regulator
LAGPDAQRDARYKPAEVCRLADVQPYVLRYWESEFPFLAPNRNAPGPRSYSETDLQLIRRIKKLLYDEGYTIAGAKKRLEGELKKGVPLFDDTELGEAEPADLLPAVAGSSEMSLDEATLIPFDPDDTGAGAPPPPRPKRKAKVPPPPPAPPSDSVAIEVLEAESPAAVPVPGRTPPPIPHAPPALEVAPAGDSVVPPTVVVKTEIRVEKDPRVARAVAELKDILAILRAD